MLAAAPDSWALWRERSKLGMAIDAIIRMIATTISSSRSEKPRCVLGLLLTLAVLKLERPLPPK